MVYQGYQLNIFSWTLFALTTPFVFIRLYVELRMHHRPYRELFVLVAWILYLVTVIMDSILIDWDWWNVPAWEGKDMSDERMAPIMKVMWVPAFTYMPSIWACKMALLCFYGDLTAKWHRKTWWAIRSMWVLVIIGVVFQILRSLVLCKPFHLNWSFNNGDCGFSQPLTTTAITLHMFTDLVIYAIPFFIMRSLSNLTIKQKRSAYIMFGAGFMHLGTAVVLLLNAAIPWDAIEGWQGATDFSSTVDWFSCIQQGTAIMIICMPQVRRLWLGLSAEKLRPELKDLPQAIANVDVEKGETNNGDGKEGGEMEKIISKGSVERITSQGTS